MPALAQPAPNDESVRAMHTYGYCVVERAPNRSRRVLTLPPGSEEERDLLQAVSTDLCLSGHGHVSQMSFQPQLLRGVIAEAVLDSHNARRDARGRAAMVVPFTGLTLADIAGLEERGRAALRALDFSQCVVAAAPDTVSALLQTEPTSEAEDRAFEQLVPHLSPCLSQGAQLNIVKPQLRGFLAEASYRAAYVAANEPR